MNFRDLDQQHRYSFEIYPPKDAAGITSLFEVLRELGKFQPGFISCTYGAMGSTRSLTRDLVVRIRNELNLTTAFHFTCVGSDREAIRSYVEQLRDQGISLVVALRGDPPGGIGSFVKPENGFAYANELVAFLKEIGGFSIAVAGYPEKHIEAPDKETDLKNLVRKVRAGADVVITQLFFDNADFFDFVDRAHKIGIHIPIVPGIMPIVNFKQIEKITRMCGATLPPKLYDRISRCQSDSHQVTEIGIEHALGQCRQLLENGVPGIHFYTLDKAYSTRRIVEQL